MQQDNGHVIRCALLFGLGQQPIQTAVKILLVHDLEQHFLIRHRIDKTVAAQQQEIPLLPGNTEAIRLHLSVRP